MNAPRRKIIVRRTKTAFAADEVPTTPFRSAPPEIRRDSGTRPTVNARPRSNDRPTLREGKVPREPPPVPKPPMPPRLPTPIVVEVSRPAVAPPPPESSPSTWLRVPDPFDDATTERRGPRASKWTIPIAIVLMVVACELSLARYGGQITRAATIATHALGIFAGD
jgi:hypothetical protein